MHTHMVCNYVYTWVILCGAHTCACDMNVCGCVLSCTCGSVCCIAVCTHTDECIALCVQTMYVCLSCYLTGVNTGAVGVHSWGAIGKLPESCQPRHLAPCSQGAASSEGPGGPPSCPPDPKQDPMQSGKV